METLPDDLVEHLSEFVVEDADVLSASAVCRSLQCALRHRVSASRLRRLLHVRYAPRYRNKMEAVGLIAFTRFYDWTPWNVADACAGAGHDTITKYTRQDGVVIRLSEASILRNLLLPQN